MTLRLLIDARLTPVGAVRLRERLRTQVDVVHVNEVLPPAATDIRVLTHAKHDRRAVLTANIGDFGAVARTIPDPAGIGLVGEQNGRDQQVGAMTRLVDALIRHAERGGDVSGCIFRLRRTGRLAVHKGG